MEKWVLANTWQILFADIRGDMNVLRMRRETLKNLYSVFQGFTAPF